eukprot:6177379-Pleurochrysis_carterae.AAC.1
MMTPVLVVLSLQGKGCRKQDPEVAYSVASPDIQRFVIMDIPVTHIEISPHPIRAVKSLKYMLWGIKYPICIMGYISHQAVICRLVAAGCGSSSGHLPIGVRVLFPRCHTQGFLWCSKGIKSIGDVN